MSEHHDRGAVLLAIARDAIQAPPEGGMPRTWQEAWLRDSGATFVTLRLAGDLRGCIGSLEAVRPLGEDVHANARAAAYRDPRFPPLPSADIAALEVEVSVLSPRSAVAVESERDAVAALRPGIDGVVLEYDGRRATFLPQVWEGLPDPLMFLSELRLKADLPARFWHPSLLLSRYTVEKYR
jgi:AmmeMemoRadiSam system protein A